MSFFSTKFFSDFMWAFCHIALVLGGYWLTIIKTKWRRRFGFALLSCSALLVLLVMNSFVFPPGAYSGYGLMLLLIVLFFITPYSAALVWIGYLVGGRNIKSAKGGPQNGPPVTGSE